MCAACWRPTASLVDFYRCRTVLAFAKSIKPNTPTKLWKYDDKSCAILPFTQRKTGTKRALTFSTDTIKATRFFKFFQSIKLVVMMSAVETWKARQVLLCVSRSAEDAEWPIVFIAENAGRLASSRSYIQFLSTGVHRKSESFASLLHTVYARQNSTAFALAALRAEYAGADLRWGIWPAVKILGGRGREKPLLLQGVH